MAQLLPPTATVCPSVWDKLGQHNVRLRITSFYKSFSVGEAVHLGVPAANYRTADGKGGKSCGKRQKKKIFTQNYQTETQPDSGAVRSVMRRYLPLTNGDQKKVKNRPSRSLLLRG